MLRSLPIAALLFCGCPDQSVKAVNANPDATVVSHGEGDVLLEGDTVTFQGIVSDADHQAVDLLASWSLGGEEICAQAAPSSDGATSCEATVDVDDTSLTLEVVDPMGAAGAALLNFVVTPTDAPNVSITAPEPGGVYYGDQLIGFEGQVEDAEDEPGDLTVWWESSLEGELSVDADPDSSGLVLGTGYLEEGEHALTLTARDSSGKTGSDSVVITVGPPNSAPSCEITAPDSGSAGEEGALVTFEGQVGDDDVSADTLALAWSSDKDGDIGTSTPNSDGSVSFPYTDLSVNTHVVSLVVTDEVGTTCTDSVIYTVGTPPELSLSSPSSGEVYNEGESITFSASVSDNEDSPSSLDLSWESSLDGVISTQGADSSGLAQFSSSALATGEHTLTLTVTDTAGLYAVAMATFTFNALPTAPTVAISPDPATTSNTLVASATGSADPDGSGTVTFAYAWYESGVLSTASTSASFPSSATTKGLRYRVVVTPSDGTGDGATGEAEITIDNSEPVITTPTISPSTGVYRSETLSCTATATDADGDTPTVTYAWTNGATSIGTGASVTLTASTASPGDTVTCTATATDDLGATDTASSAVTVENGLPSITSVTISPDPAYAIDTLACSYGGFSDPDGDGDVSTYAWTVNGSSAGSASTLSGAFVKGDAVVCTVTPSDGIDDGTPVSDSLTVSNSLPVLDDVTLGPEPVYEGDTLTCTPGSYADDDGDSATFAYTWDVAGADPGVVTSTLSSAYFDRDETVVCGVTPNDGTDDGTMVGSNIVTVSNSAPSITSVTVSPSSPSTTDTLSCVYAGFGDADGDADASTYAWTVNGSSAGSGSTLSTSLSSGDVVVCTVTPHDGTDAGTALSYSVSVANAPPEVDSVNLSPGSAYTDDVITASVSTSDDDGDSVTVSYEWYVDGSAVGETGASLDGASYFDKHQDVYVVVTPNDGTEDGASVSSSSLTVLNTPPTAPTVSIDPADPEEGVDDLICQLDTSSTDADGDSIDYEFSWTVDGADYPDDWDTGFASSGWTGPDSGSWTDDTVPGEDTIGGEEWTCAVTPWDGDDHGSSGSDAVTIEAAASGCPSVSSSYVLDGPHSQYGFCWYLGGDGVTCDTVCSAVGGSNLASSAESAWSDNCSTPDTDDITYWFYTNGNAGGWASVGGATAYHTVGYGYRSSGYYGKCSTGSNTNAGAYPGENNGHSDRSLTCPCFTDGT